LRGTSDRESNRVTDHLATEMTVETIAKASARLGPVHRLSSPLIEARHRCRAEQGNGSDGAHRKGAERFGAIGRFDIARRAIGIRYGCPNRRGCASRRIATLHRIDTLRGRYLCTSSHSKESE
jgi:hypothetical protein